MFCKDEFYDLFMACFGSMLFIAAPSNHEKIITDWKIKPAPTAQ